MVKRKELRTHHSEEFKREAVRLLATRGGNSRDIREYDRKVARESISNYTSHNYQFLEKGDNFLKIVQT